METDKDIQQALEIYATLKHTRICVFGGDGTVGWILSILADRYASRSNPPVSICPLGTGNDLSRVLGWGWHYEKQRLMSLLVNVSAATPVVLDRWKISFNSLETSVAELEHANYRRCLSCFLEHPKFVRGIYPPSYQNYRTPLNSRFISYFSFGLDGAVVLDFHDRRISNPSKFTSPFKNKLIYLHTSLRYFKEFTLWRSWSLAPYMRLICDGKNITDSIRQCHSLVLLNISSYGSGASPWGRTSKCCQKARNSQFNINDESSAMTSQHVDTFDRNGHLNVTSKSTKSFHTAQASEIFHEQNFGDEKIEIIGLDSIQMALIHLGLRGRRIAQCNEVRIELLRPMPAHMDGEPFYIAEPTAIDIKHAGQVLVLRKQKK
jgi:diacylglycerol kinase (ATP)